MNWINRLPVPSFFWAGPRRAAVRLVAPCLTLRPGDLLSLRDAAGTHLWCAEGRVWVTQEGDARDHRIVAGETFVFDRNGRAVVQALAYSRVRVDRAGV